MWGAVPEWLRYFCEVMTNADYQELQPTLPDLPGVYTFLDGESTVLYVGKAKSLKKRIASYFGEKKQAYYKTRLMVRAADRLTYTITESEHDALLLENSLIKKYRPRYNVSFKDDKSYSYICIRKERFPRVYFTRKVIRDGSTYFGPYTSKMRAALVLDLIRKLFPLRTCTLNLSRENIEKGKFKVCLEYHIKNCMGPCAGLETEEAYMEKIEQIRHILSGQFREVKRHLQAQLERCIDQLAFEEAHQIKVRLDALEDYQSKSVVVNPNIRDVDVFAIAVEDKSVYVNYLKVVQGAVIHAVTQELTRNLEEEPSDILPNVILEMRERYHSVTPEIIAPFPLDYLEEDVRITVPQRGDMKKLLDMSAKNVAYFQAQKRQQAATREKRQTPADRILTALRDALRMKELPVHIECFDNSNLHGSHPVSSCVVFRHAKPSKGDYRHYKVRSVTGPDDFASMGEVVFRRYRRLLEEKASLPQLVIIDGGKGQLSAAMDRIRQLGLEGAITVVGIAKRLEEIYFPGDPLPLYINKKSEALKLIQQARNEAHRFAITFHRQLRSKGLLRTSLTDIPGVGEKTAEKLLQRFGSVKNMLAAGPEGWTEAAGARVAARMSDYFFGESEAKEPEEQAGSLSDPE